MMELQEKKATGYLNESFRLFHLRDKAVPQMGEHFHDFYKVVVFISGKVTYVIGDKAYKLEPWDIVLVGRNSVHSTLMDGALTYERMVLWMRPDFLERNSTDTLRLSRCFDLAQEKGSFLIRPKPSDCTKIMNCLGTAHEEQGSDKMGSREAAAWSVLQFMLQLNRIADTHIRDMEKNENSGYPKMDQIISYINNNLTEPLTIEQLSASFNISKSYLMFKFKDITGSTVHNYIRKKRLLMAAEMIRRGVPSVQASVKCGFGDYSVFLKGFKQLFGCLPRQL